MASTSPTALTGTRSAEADAGARAGSVFPSASALPRTVAAKSCVSLALGGAVLITVSLGPMAAALGNVSWLVWAGTALIGALQCVLLAELCSSFPSRAGGTPQYAHRALPGGSPLLGAISGWSYWVAWTPGIAVNLLLAGEYLAATVHPLGDGLVLTVILGLALYLLNLSGLRLSILGTVLAGLAVAVPLLLILGVPAVDSRASYAHSVLSFSLPGGEQGAIDVFALIAGWTFVAAWAAYGAEMASALSGEVRDAVRAMPRVMALSAAITLLAYTTVPLALIGLVGAAGVAGSPETPFLPPAEVVFGGAGRIVVGLMLTGALVLSAQVFIIASSRTVYQMARDGHLPRTLSRVNRRGVPVGSIVLDASIIAIVLLIFGRDVVEIVAAANVSYLVVFVLMPIAYLALRAHAPEDASAFRMRRAGPLAIFLALFNVALLVVGGSQWGATTMLTGTLLTLLIIPVSLFCRSRASREK